MTYFYLLHLVSFFVGSIPIGYFVAKAQGIDVRTLGSGNTGATNVGRVVGKKAGIITLVGDLAKGACATLLVFLAPVGAIESYAEFSELAAGLGFFAVLGHCFSPFLRFRGGKGVAAGLGIFLVLAPLPALGAVLVFILVVKATRYVSLGSISAALAVPLFIWASGAAGLGGAPSGPMLQLTSVLAAMLISFRHRGNLARLAAGTEPQIKAKASAGS